MGIKRNFSNLATDTSAMKRIIKIENKNAMIKIENNAMIKVENAQAVEVLQPFLEELELYNSHTSMASMASEDIWKKFDLPTPPLSPMHEGDDDLELENLVMPFDIDTEELLLFEESISEDMKEITGFPKSPPGIETCNTGLQSNLIQDIMWSAPPIIDGTTSPTSNAEIVKDKQRLRCNSCSNPGPFNAACVAPDEVLMETNIGGTMSKTKVNLGMETPSDSEEEIDVVTVEKQLHVAVPTKRKFKSEDGSYYEHPRERQTVTLTIEKKPGNIQTITKCTSVRQRLDCPTDVHNYSLPMTSLKRVHSYPSTPVTHKSKKLKRDMSVPSDLKKVAQKLKCSVGTYSRSSSDSEDMCDVGKRAQHNVLERKRRTDLKNSFFHLRDSVPELEGQERAPKVVILRKASQYIYRLIEEQKQQDREVEQLRAKKEKLKKLLSKLRDY